MDLAIKHFMTGVQTSRVYSSRNICDVE